MNKRSGSLRVFLLIIALYAGMVVAGQPTDTAASTANVAATQDGGPGHNLSYGDIVLRQTDVLKLSADQVDKITRLHQANQQQLIVIGLRMREAKQSAYTLFLNPAKDEAVIRQAAEAFTLAFGDMLETALKTRQGINAVLTPEQLNTLRTLKVTP